MQRLRALLHVLDRLVERGHEIYIYRKAGKQGSIAKGGKRMKETDLYSPKQWYNAPWDIDCLTPGALDYLCKCFGFHVDHLDKVNWVKRQKGRVKADIVLATDYIPVETNSQVNLPYNDFYCKTTKGDILVGNGMCEELKTRQKSVKERSGQLLIVHPGGGRSILSPLRDHIDKWEVIQNNIDFLQRIFSAIPYDVIDQVIIKTHPAPYKCCDVITLADKVIPRLDVPSLISPILVDNNLLDHMCHSEYILTMGSSTTVWLLGSDKKWLNIVECAKYDLKSEKRRDKQARFGDWYVWPQNIIFDQLNEALSDYSNYFDWSEKWKRVYGKYKKWYNLTCKKNVVNVIEGLVK